MTKERLVAQAHYCRWCGRGLPVRNGQYAPVADYFCTKSCAIALGYAAASEGRVGPAWRAAMKRIVDFAKKEGL